MSISGGGIGAGPGAEPRVYLDWNATTPVRAEAKAAMIAAMDLAGNPSSVHAEGRAAKALVEKARASIAELLGARPQEVIFTGGATESASVLRNFACVEVEPTAHSALWAWHRPGDSLPVQTGADPAPMLQRIRAIGLANSETGILAPVPARDEGALLLLDITQVVGRVPFAFGWSGADLALTSAHKFGGPKGVGVLLVRGGLDLPPLSIGGGQEMNRRSGTENVPGIVGMAAAMQAAMKDHEDGVWTRVAALRDAMEARLAAAMPGLIFVGQERERLPNTTCMILPGWKGETQVMQMDLAGFAVSAGSACSSGKVRPSRVLAAMGYDDVAASSSIRVSLGPQTSEAEVMRFADAWAAAAQRHLARAA